MEVGYFEAHITLPWPLPAEGLNRVDLEHLGKLRMFHFSVIDGDEVLGKGKHAYLTRSGRELATLEQDMKALGLELDAANTRWTRCKIEAVIFDERREVLARPAVTEQSH